MLDKMFDTLVYGVLIFSLFFIDYILGNGIADIFQAVFCKIACFVNKSIKEEAQARPILENPISLPVLVAEITALAMTMALLKKYTRFRSRDRMDTLLQESKDTLRKTNEFLEKWRLRRIHWQMPTEYSYLDEEPQEIKPLKLEVPILHMAIIDTLGTTRSQPESGDAGDTINFTDSTLLSVTSLLDDDESIGEPHDEMTDVQTEDRKNLDLRNRYLWDVMEEEGNLED